MRIWHKLALVMVTTMAFVIVVSFVLAQINFRHDFSGYLKDQERRHVETLTERLVEVYAQNTNWESLRNNPRAWMRLLKGSFRSVAPIRDQLKSVLGERAPEFDRPPPPPRHDNNHAAPPHDKQGFPPKFGHKGPKPSGRHALLDPDKNLIVGLMPRNGEIEDYPIRHEEMLIGYLRVKTVSDFTDKLDQRFVESQKRAYIVIAFCALLLSLIAAWLLARYFRRRLSQLTAIAHDLTAGKFDQRISIEHEDELADLGERFNQLAETLEKNRHAQKGWIADISHELRTPLAILSGEIEALQDGIRPLNKTALHSLASETAHLKRLVDDLYQLAIADVGKLNYQKSDVDLHDVITHIVQQHQNEFSKSGLSLRTHFEADKNATLFADKQRLTQMLVNLLDNARKYTDTGGQVLIKTRIDPENITLTIEDSAPGISTENLTTIFDRLYRVEASRNRKTGGAGLGLAIVQKIVEAHQGTIRSDHSSLGGLKIEIVLPKGYALA